MKFELKEVSGVTNAILALKFSKRNYNDTVDGYIRYLVYKFSNPNGFIYNRNNTTMTEEDNRQWGKLEEQLNVVSKWGAGVGFNSNIDAGHETILRFIDLTFVVTGLHRGAQDDLDSHAMRMNNRIVRSSSRLGVFGSDEMSDWYKTRIISFEDIMDVLDNKTFDFPEIYIDCDDNEYVKTSYGYIRKDLLEDKDTMRGLYRLSIPSDCIFTVSLHDFRHIYKRRNKWTHAAPELAEGIEQARKEVEEKLHILGMLVAHDYCDDGKMHHIMNISKHYTPNYPDAEDTEKEIVDNDKKY